MTIFEAIRRQIDETEELDRRVVRIRVTEDALEGSIAAAPLFLGEYEIVIHPADYLALRWEMEGVMNFQGARTPMRFVQVSVDGVPVIHGGEDL